MGMSFVSYDKLSKKAKKEIDKKKRKMWDFNPSTTRVESKKAYNRQRSNKLPIDF